MIHYKLLMAFLMPTSPLILLTLKQFSFTNTNDNFVLLPHYNGQADLLLSLNIFPDYYPYQFKQHEIYDYLKNVSQYSEINEKTTDEKKLNILKIQKKLNKLFSQVKKFGPSLWNQDLYDSGAVYRNDQFWTNMKTKYLLLEQYLVDDYLKLSEAINKLPQHEKVITTNFRVSKDPYLIFNENTFSFFKSIQDITIPATTKNSFDSNFKDYIKDYNKISRNSLYRFGKFIDYWNDHTQAEPSGGTSGTNSDPDLLVSQNTKVFDPFDSETDKKLAKLYQEAVFSDEEKQLLNIWTETGEWTSNYIKNLTPSNTSIIKKTHHPALEHQTIKGSSPLSEGSQKDVMIYLLQLAKKISKITDIDSSDPRFSYISNALKHSKKIISNYQERISRIRDYFQSLNVIDPQFNPSKNNYSTCNSKSLGIITYSPTGLGEGNSTMQSISKYSFIYSDIGFRQVTPDEDHFDELFSVDDNGWWWNIGNNNLNTNHISAFENKADSIIFLSTNDNWYLLNKGNDIKLSSLSKIFKTTENFSFDSKKINSNNYKLSFSQYNLWNEGLRSPISINLLLDNLVEIIRRQYDGNKFSNENKYQLAQNWGDYWITDFVSGI